jgi:hypothetical protein
MGSAVLPFKLERVWHHARQAETLELLDRVTVLAEHYEEAAEEVFLAELARRGLGPEEIRQHERTWKPHVIREDGQVRTCERCSRAAVHRGQGWHRLFGYVPILKRTQFLCATHAEVSPEGKG